MTWTYIKHKLTIYHKAIQIYQLPLFKSTTNATQTHHLVKDQIYN